MLHVNVIVVVVVVVVVVQKRHVYVNCYFNVYVYLCNNFFFFDLVARLLLRLHVKLMMRTNAQTFEDNNDVAAVDEPDDVVDDNDINLMRWTFKLRMYKMK